MANSERTVKLTEGTLGGWYIKLPETSWDRRASKVQSEGDWSTVEWDNSCEGRKHGDGWNEDTGIYSLSRLVNITILCNSTQYENTERSSEWLVKTPLFRGILFSLQRYFELNRCYWVLNIEQQSIFFIFFRSSDTVMLY